MTTREKALATRDKGFDKLMMQRARDIYSTLGIEVDLASPQLVRVVEILITVDECARIEALRRAEEKTNG